MYHMWIDLNKNMNVLNKTSRKQSVVSFDVDVIYQTRKTVFDHIPN